MSFSEPPDDEDRLREVFRRTAHEPAADLAERVRRRLRHRRRLRGIAAAAALLAGIATAAWFSRPGLPKVPPVAVRPPEEAPAPRTSSAVVWSPPVETLQALTREQEALLTALEDLQ